MRTSLFVFWDTALAFLCCLLQLSAIMTMKTTMALFMGEIGGSTLAAGMLLAIMVACSVAVKPVVGAMLDKSGAKPMMTLVACACLTAVLCHLFALWTASIPLALAGAVLAGVAYSTLSVTEIPLFTGQALRPAQIGDCKQPRKIHDAIFEGWYLGMNI